MALHNTTRPTSMLPHQLPPVATTSPVPGSPADILNGLAELATSQMPCVAALLLETTDQGLRLAGQCGLTTDQADAVLTGCAQPDAGPISVPGLPAARVQTLPLPAQDGHLGGLLVLLLAPDATASGNATRLTPLARLAAAQLRWMADHTEQHAAGQPLPAGLGDGSALSESESRLNLTERTAGVGSWSIDLVNQAVHHSEGCAHILGLRESQTRFDLEFMISRYAPEWRKAMRQRLARCTSLGEGFDEEIQVLVPEGGLKWVRTVGDAVRDGQGRVIRVQGAMQDISSQKQAQEETTRLAMRLTTTLASITEAFVTLDRQCCFTYLNHESERLLQRTTGELLGLAVWDGFDEALAAHLRDKLTNALTTNRRVELEAHFATLGKWLEVRAYPFAEGLAVYFRDVTDRRHAQEQLMLLEASVAQLNDIVVIVETGVATRQEARIVFANKAFEEQTGYEREEVMGQTPRLLLELEPAMVKLREMSWALERNRKARTEMEVRRKNQTTFWVELEVVAVQLNQEVVTHWVAIERDITQRKLGEQKEARLRGGFQLLFLGNPHPMWVFDRETRAFLEVNNAAIEQYGYSREEFLARTIDDIRTESERARLRNRAFTHSPDGRERVGSWLHLRKNGTQVVVDITTQVLNYNGREAELVVAMDITEQVALEQQRAQALLAVQASQASLARSQSLARMGSWERQAQDRSAVWSANLYALTGRDPALGPPSVEQTMDSIHPDDRADYLQTMTECLREGVARSWTYRCLQADGSIRWYEENIDEPRRDAGGAVLSVGGTVQDVTERVEAEARLQLQLSRTELLNHIVRATDERLDLDRIFRVVCDNIESRFSTVFSAALLFDPQTQTFTVAHLGTQGTARGAQVGLNEGDVLQLPDSGLARCSGGELLYEPALADSAFDWPRRLARAGMDSAVFAPLQAQGEVLGVLVAGRVGEHGFDSGECEFMRQLAEHVALAASQARLHRSLQQAYDELSEAQQVVLQQERLRVLGQMASGIAHDINNAISPVALYTESLLVNESALSDRGRAQLQTVQLAIDDVAETVARMREFYRPSDAGVQRRAVDLNQLARQVLDLTRARWRDMPQQAGVSIDVALDLGDLPSPVFVMEGEIRDAVTNLVINAVDAMPEGGTLTLRTRRTVMPDGGVRVQLDVSDTGIGMEPETQRRCLEPFFTTKGQRGSGLGLAMVYGSMQRHGADISIESTPGEGTTICLGFPEHGAIEAVEVVAVDALALPQPLKILLVDDDPLLLRSLSETLGAEGHAVFTAAGGSEGIAVFKAALSVQVFDVVITDLGMPDVDGRAVAAAVKAASPGTPVVMLTGWGRRMQEEGESPPHVDHLLSKPPRLEALRAVFRSVA